MYDDVLVRTNVGMGICLPEVMYVQYDRSEEHTSELQSQSLSRMPSSA